MDALFQPAADALGASTGQLKLIACLLIAYPLGSVFVRIPSSQPALRHLFNLSVAVFFFLPMLGIYSAFLHLLADVLFTYFVTKNVKGPNMPWIVFSAIMTHLTVNQVIRALNGHSYETIDVTGPQMVMTMKLTTFAWNVLDGRRPSEELDKWQTAYQVKVFPSLLQFLGYSFYFPGVLVGPWCEYQAYENLVTEQHFDGHTIKDNNSRKIPKGRKRVAYIKMLMGLAYLGFFVVFGGSYNFMEMLKPWYKDLGMGKRILFLQFFGICERTKYYALWTLTEGASILTGHGFSGFTATGKSTWNGAANVNVPYIELAPNFKLLLDSWNMKANVWLRECIYKRLAAKGKKPGFKSNMLTFATSALWHGIAIGYYLTFLFGGFITTAARLARASIRPLALPVAPKTSSSTKAAYDILTTLVTVLIVNYATTPFMLGNLSDSIESWNLVGWYGHIVIAGALVFFYAGGAKFLKGVQAKKGLVVDNKAQNGKIKVNGHVIGSEELREKSFQVPPSLDKVVPPPTGI